MKRYLPLAILCLILPVSAFALDARPQRGDRVGVLSLRGDGHAFGRSLADSLPSYLVRELRSAGYDAYKASDSIDEIEARPRANDDFYIEVSFAEVDGGDYGGVGVNRKHVGAEVAVVAAHLSVELRVYEARSMNLVESLELDASSVMPTLTGLGVGGRDGYLFLSLPFFERMPYRVAAKRIAREAAHRLSSPRRSRQGETSAQLRDDSAE